VKTIGKFVKIIENQLENKEKHYNTHVKTIENSLRLQEHQCISKFFTYISGADIRIISSGHLTHSHAKHDGLAICVYAFMFTRAYEIMITTMSYLRNLVYVYTIQEILFTYIRNLS
jgi:hypothetical protein